MVVGTISTIVKKIEGELQQKANQKRSYDATRTRYIENQGFKVIKIWECEFWKNVKENKDGIIKTFMKNNFPFKAPMGEGTLLEKVRCSEIFGMIECDVSVPIELRPLFEDFPPIFKNVEVSRDDIGEHMKNYAEVNGLLKRPQKMTISSYFQKQGLFITPLLKYYMTLGIKVSNVCQLIEFDNNSCFKPFVQSVVDARRGGDTNPDSCVVAETMKLIGNSAYGYQLMDRTRHTNTKYVDNSKIDRTINSKHYRSLNEICPDSYEVTSSRPIVEHREPIVLGFFVLQYSKMRMLELVYNFFVRFCDRNLYQFIEMDTDSLYMALAKDNIDDCVRPEMLDEWKELRLNDCRENFRANSLANFFPRTCCPVHIKHDKREPGLFKEEWRGDEMIALCSKTYCGINEATGDVKFSCKGINKQFLEEPAAKYRKVLETTENGKSINKGFRCINNSMMTYSLQKKGLAYFYPKRKVMDDGVSTIPLDL